MVIANGVPRSLGNAKSSIHFHSITPVLMVYLTDCGNSVEVLQPSIYYYGPVYKYRRLEFQFHNSLSTILTAGMPIMHTDDQRLY